MSNSEKTKPGPKPSTESPLNFRSQQDVAAMFGVTQKTISDWIIAGMPGMPYVKADILSWWVDNRLLKRPEVIARFRDQTSEDVLKKEKLQEQVMDLKFKRAEKVGDLIPRKHITAWYELWAELMRNAKELLIKHYDPAAGQIVEDVTDKLGEEIKKEGFFDRE